MLSCNDAMPYIVKRVSGDDAWAGIRKVETNIDLKEFIETHRVDDERKDWYVFDNSLLSCATLTSSAATLLYPSILFTTGSADFHPPS